MAISAVGPDLDAPYWEALAEGKVAMQRCTCGSWHWPAVTRCAECGAFDPPWQRVAIEGELFSWATTHHAFGGTEALGVPYTTVLVALPHANGKRLLGLLDGDPAALSAGVRMIGSVDTTVVREKKVSCLCWRLAQAAR